VKEEFIEDQSKDQAASSATSTAVKTKSPEQMDISDSESEVF